MDPENDEQDYLDDEEYESDWEEDQWDEYVNTDLRIGHFTDD